MEPQQNPNSEPGNKQHEQNPQTKQTAPLEPTPQPSIPVTPSVSVTPGVPEPDLSHNSPGLIVLQWLTYAFWGWTVLGVSILTASVLANIIAKSETGGFTPYGIAAVLVLLPLSIACDVFYSKKEPQKFSGASSIVMVIHAVIFALFGIGALITAVISLVLMLVNSTASDSSKVALYSALIITVLYGAVFLRTINPKKLPVIRRFFIIFMSVVVGIIAVLGIVGPVANERATRDDRLIVANINTVKYAIDDYVREQKKLPESLDALNLSGDAQVLLDRRLVDYKPNTKSATINTDDLYNSLNYGTSSNLSSTKKTFYYELCATFTKENKDRYGYNSSSGDEYETYLNVYDHPAGEKCYKLKTSEY